MTLRIGLARLAHETNARSPLPVALHDFAQTHLLDGEALAAALAPGGHEVEGLLRRAELRGAADAARRLGVTPVPLGSAWTVPGGRLTAAAFDALLARLVEAIGAAGDLDGMVLALHGAMAVEGHSAPEQAVLEAVRAALPAEALLAVTYDLHAHITPAKLHLPDLVFSYLTNPHRDLAQTGARAMRGLVARIRGELSPTLAWRSLPMVLGGGTTVDLAPAMFGVFRHLRRLNRRRGVISASLFVCHPWVDDPSPCWAVQVTTDDDQAGAEALADALADAAWGVRHHPLPEPLRAPDAIARVRRARIRRKLGVSALVDVSDVVGAGAPGDHTGMLRALLAHAPDLRSYVPLRDPEAVATLAERAVGDAVTLAVGGTWSDPATHRVDVEGTLLHAGHHHGLGRTATLDLGGVVLVLTEGPPLALRPAFFTAVGLDVWAADIVVVKSLLLWLPWFLLHARQRMLVRTKGPTDFDAILDGPFAHPIHPRDALDDWRAHDRSVRSCP